MTGADPGGERLALLLEMSARLAEQMDVEAIAGFVLDTGVKAVGARAGTLCLLSRDCVHFDVAGHVGYDDDIMQRWQRFPADAPVPAGDAIRTGQAILIGSRDELIARYPMFAPRNEGATAVVPLIVRERPLGAIAFTFAGGHEFRSEEQDFLESLARHCAAAIDRAQLYEAALRRQAHLTLIAEVSSVLATGTDDLDAAIKSVTQLVIPDLADMCGVFLVESGDVARLVAWSSVELPRHTTAATVGGEYQLSVSKSAPLATALHLAELVVWDDPSGIRGDVGVPQELRVAMTDLGIGPGALIPLVARSRAVGVLVLANTPDRELDDEHVAVATTLAQRMSVLIDNARLLAQRTEISKGLQAALLPPTLPTIDGFETAARYRPAGEGLEVGGDFYDAIALAPDRWLFVVGDVTGHGVRAAALTGLLRHTIGAAARLGSSPREVLAHANRVLVNRQAGTGADAFATVALLELSWSPGQATVVVSSAGHPPPLLRHADGRVRELVATGRLLGFFPDLDVEEVTATLAPCESIIAYTDGVIERRGTDGQWFRDVDLAQLVASCTECDAEEIAARIEETVVRAFDTPLSDDIAILVLRRTP